MALWTDEDEQAEMAEVLEKRNGGRTRDGRICSCGHPATRHRVVELPGRPAVSRCQPGRTSCACGELVAVVEVRDTRPFLAKTDGPGVRHALMVGSEKLAGKYPDADEADLFTWLVELECPMPGCGLKGPREVRPFPMLVSGNGHVSVSWKTERQTGFACKEHLALVPRAHRPDGWND